MPTFTELGIPFGLFEAAVICAEGDYLGLRKCSLCGAGQQHCFNLDIGANLIVRCSKCGTENGLDISDRESTPCYSCGAKVRFPFFLARRPVACYRCLRSGKVALTKDTELGMISWKQTVDGITHGGPGLTHPDFEMVVRDSGWCGARLPREAMFELLRTPAYETWQGEKWLFCCQAPMVFVGEWNHRDYNQHASDGNGQRLFEEIVEDIEPDHWEHLPEARPGVYVFRCNSCASYRAHWDCG